MFIANITCCYIDTGMRFNTHVFELTARGVIFVQINRRTGENADDLNKDSVEQIFEERRRREMTVPALSRYNHQRTVRVGEEVPPQTTIHYKHVNVETGLIDAFSFIAPGLR